ncbi:MAG: HD domain-containing protein [Sulfurovum sp.]|nr:HD domain-containing protein [Sulfurovum sp.]
MQRTSSELLNFIFLRIGEIATSDGDTKLHKLSEMARDIVFADRCTIWICDKAHNVLWTKVSHGVGHIIIKPDNGLVGVAIQSKNPLIVNEVYTDHRFNTDIDKQTGYMTKTMMVIPMKDAQGQVTGAIQVINKKDDADFTAEDLTHLNLATTYVTESIRSMLLLQEIDATQKELINIMSMVAEKRSKETGEHIQRVAAYTKLLATLYGMDEAEATLLSEASPMHDVGKIAIPDKIIQKPGSLNPQEWEVMKTHAVLGYNMLKNSKRKLLQTAAIIAHEHHERYDGTGYPRGLAGEEIHIYGRIVALADVFDALNSKRVYKDAWKLDEIFLHLEKQKAKQFDPELVDLLLSNKEKFVNIQDKVHA